MIDDALTDKDIVDHLLNSNSETNDTIHIDEDDMSSYLNYAAKQCVTMEPEAEEMLQDYYSAVRVVRPGEFKCILRTLRRNYLQLLSHSRRSDTKSL